MKRSRIARAMDHLDEELIAGAIPSSAHTQKGGKIMKKNNWIKWTALAAAFLLVLTGGVLMTQMIASASQNTIVALDVNPSLEIEVNGKEQVVEIRALNEEAKLVIGDMNFKNVDLDVAVRALITSMLEHDFLTIDQNSILISVDTKDQKKATELKEIISGKVTDLLKNSKIEASIITQTFDKTADNGNEISSARAALIEKILAAGLADANGVAYTYDQLALLKVNELKLILESKELIEKVEGIQSTGTAGTGKLIDKEQAIAIALEKAGVSRDDVTALELEVDVSKKTQTIFYEIEFKYNGNEYEYEMIAATGEIVKEEIDADDDRIDRPIGENESAAPVGGEYISVKEATDIAYGHAGVASSDVRDMDREFKVVNGKAVYEVEFEVSKKDYDYIIDAVTGEILQATVPPSAGDATAAEDRALSDAGVARADARELKTEAVYRDGAIYAYRVEFEVRGDLEYEYTVSADGTEILDKKVDD